jgi:hypothetical protein
MRSSLRLVASALLTLIVVAATPASAAPIILRTGVDATNAVLPSGAVDPNWTISTDDGATFVSDKVLYPAQICCGMESVAGTAAWISDPSINANAPNTAWGINQDVFLRRTFDLTGYDLSTVSLQGNWRIADWTFGISLNGNLIPGTAIGNCGDNQALCGTWFSDHALAVLAGSGLFVNGLNTLEFRAQSINSGWDGLWLDAQVDGRRVVPEPSLMLLTLTALGAAGAIRRRRA